MPDIFIRSQSTCVIIVLFFVFLLLMLSCCIGPTVITFSFKDFGHQLLSSWTNPIRDKFQLPLNNNSHNKQQKRSPMQVVNMNIRLAQGALIVWVVEEVHVAIGVILMVWCG